MISGIRCRHFIGEKPCRFNKRCDPKNCRDFAPFGKRILIIKLAAIGDVLRTTPILPVLKKRHPLSHITWVTARDSIEILEGNSHIDRIYTIDHTDIIRLLAESFDILISLDKNMAAASLASIIKAVEKKGFGSTPYGNLCIFNNASRYSFELGFNDELKFKVNRKTYQEMIFEMCELGDRYGEYILTTDASDADYAKNLFKKWKIKNTDRIVGLNTGAGKVFLTKKWAEDSFIRLAEYLNGRLKTRVLLLGGLAEMDINAHIAAKARGTVINTGNSHSIKQFAELIGLCDLIVSSDTLAMHLAIAKKIPAVALFGSTSPYEADIYGRGIKMFLNLECSPCYKYRCDDMRCMDSLSPEMVFKACSNLLK